MSDHEPWCEVALKDINPEWTCGACDCRTERPRKGDQPTTYRIIPDGVPAPSLVVFNDDGELLGALVPVKPIPITECWDRRNCCIHSEWKRNDDE